MRPAPADIVQQLRTEGRVTAEQAEMARSIPMSSDICIEADSGGHTDGGIPTVLLPAMLQLRQEITSQHKYAEPICMGLAGGIGEPRAAAAAFFMGADFILTGSVNQCSVEAGTSDLVKEMLQSIDVQDTDYAPAGDMFESGSKVQVLRKGVFFPARAQKLHSLYLQYDGLDQLPQSLRQQIEKNYFGKTFGEVWEESTRYLIERGRRKDVAMAESSPKRKMVHVFKWYFGYTTDLALAGNPNGKVNFQVHTGPALGAFNRWVKGTPLESWRARHVDKIGYAIMAGAEEFIDRQFAAISGSRIALENDVSGALRTN
jgi:trans-AT polyketide synthase/acyltransferase/oxidoreductase domain-containing protein